MGLPVDWRVRCRDDPWPSFAVLVGHKARSGSIAMRACPLLAMTSTALLIIAALGVPARPPIGEGPPYVYDVGAVVGVTAAAACVVASLWAWGVVALNARMGNGWNLSDDGPTRL
jgi:hypothetical protein